jgi:hypothetical protein
VGDDEAGFSHRDALVELVAVANWTDPAEDPARMSAARRYAGTLEPFASGIYVNGLADEGWLASDAPTPGQAGQAGRAEGPLRSGQRPPPHHNIRPRKEPPR